MRVTSAALGPNEAYTVLLDGEDVSDHCFMADDELGEVGLWLDGENLDGSTPEVIRHGKVEIRPRKLKRRRRSITEWIWS